MGESDSMEVVEGQDRKESPPPSYTAVVEERQTMEMVETNTESKDNKDEKKDKKEKKKKEDKEEPEGPPVPPPVGLIELVRLKMTIKTNLNHSPV